MVSTVCRCYPPLSLYSRGSGIGLCGVVGGIAVRVVGRVLGTVYVVGHVHPLRIGYGCVVGHKQSRSLRTNPPIQSSLSLLLLSLHYRSTKAWPCCCLVSGFVKMALCIVS